MSGGESETVGSAESEVRARQGQGNLPEEDPSDPVGGGETLRDSHHQVSQLRPRVCTHEGHLSVVRFADGRWRRDRLRSGKRNLPEARLGEGFARVAARSDTVRFRQRVSEVHRLC